MANSETGILQDLPTGLAVSDITQGFGRVPFSYAWAGVEMVFLSAHKFGGPKGVGALVMVAAVAWVPGWSRSSLSDMGYWVDWANLLAIAAGFGAVALAFAWPLSAMRGALART